MSDKIINIHYGETILRVRKSNIMATQYDQKRQRITIWVKGITEPFSFPASNIVNPDRFWED